MVKFLLSIKIIKKGDRGFKRKRQKSKLNGYKFRQSFVIFNLFEVILIDSDNESCLVKKNLMKQGFVVRERYLFSLIEEIIIKLLLNLILL